MKSEELKSLIREELTKYLKESEIGGKEDIDPFVLKHMKYIPYLNILSAIAKDWGRDSDYYYSIQNLFSKYENDKYLHDKLIAKLKDFDLYNDYQHLLSLNEVSYRSFNKKISENTPKTKINKAIREIKRRIKEINKVVEFSSKLKLEMGNDHSGTWIGTKTELRELNKSLQELSRKLKNLYQ
jgi:hypothetical protein